ncbi:hypothetical protein [Ensifer sp. ZNC0028]|uniref:hypothetical protein n=1 Tax=Ensifer sp. ZNC0028 TaxID=1339236 RepID=UPI0005B87433|nr:hypothetical protein [Ensifer sp. ZNC0028]
MPGVIELTALIVSSIATSVVGANLLYLGTYALAYAGLAFGAQALQGLFVQKPSVPKPEDGSYNLKQPVPPLTYALGRVKKGSDYAALEESGGVAYHVLIVAAHRIAGYVQHYLHDDAVTLTGDIVTSPANYFYKGGAYVRLNTRLGLDAETAYPFMVTTFPTIWSNNHRGDGLATVLMTCATASSKDYLKVFPNQMPQHSAVIDGALLFDPRAPGHNPDDDNTWEFTQNLPLMRLWHLCHPVGGKLNYADMYLPDWISAANVGDQDVINRSGGTEKRYHGGFWFRANNDPVQVGRLMDEAAELVVYERPDGLIGVHAGQYVEPDIRLTADDIIRCTHDVNQRRASTVLAVRGRFTDPASRYNTVDAAIYGDPYAGEDTERTVTVDNQALQSHNHVARLQKLKYTRRNAPRVTIVAHYEAAKNVPYRRFVRVHLPPRLTEVVIEITATPKLSLRNLTIEFSGIVVPSNLYAFNAATEEGAPGASVTPLPPQGVPLPTNFGVSIATEVVSGGATAAYGLAIWDFVSDALVYELEWQPTSEIEPPRSVTSQAEETQVRSGYLSDGVQYRFRLRAWSNGASSEWTDYEIRTATADPVAPGIVTNADLTGGVGQAQFDWTAPNSPKYFASRLYLNTTNSMTGATLVATEYGAPAADDTRIVTGLSAGTYYGFIVAINSSGVPAAAVATGSAIVT